MQTVLGEKKILTLPYRRKLSDEEIDSILANWDYDPYRFDNDIPNGEIRPLYDDYGNPTIETLDSMYESLHDIGEEISIEEMQAWVDSL